MHVIGTSHLGSLLGTPARDIKFLNQVFDAGFHAYDLAASYQLGGTERLFGRWIFERKHRNKLFLISKGGHPVPYLIPNRLTVTALQHDLECSLKRLKTDYLDLYFLHRDHSKADLNAIADFLVSAKQAGKIKAFGVSNWHHERIQQLPIKIDASSPHFSLKPWVKPPFHGCISIAGPENQAAQNFYAATQIPVYAWSPLRGLPSSEIAACISYLASQPFPVHPILGSRNLEHLKLLGGPK
jgi:aryl-alcohol dehydrogenase-like predicted oxidoreductase